MKAIMFTVVLLALAPILALAPVQDPPRITGGGIAAQDVGTRPSFQNMQAQIDALDARVTVLELRRLLIHPDHEDEAEADMPSHGRIMRLDGVDTIMPDGTRSPELDRLAREVSAMERVVQSQERTLASLAGSGANSSGSSSSSGRGGYSRSAAQIERRRAQAELLAKYRRQLGKKKQEYAAVERQLNEPKQIIHGHWASKIITLNTTRDLGNSLAHVDVGEVMTWSGRLLQADAESEEWVIASLAIAETDGDH